jgi:RNA polymerase sigma factor (sigma-70 family)
MRVFPTTVWQRIRDAQAGRATALEDLLGRYRPAIVGFHLRRGATPEEAEDLAQEVLLALADRRLLARAEEKLGRFRSLIIAVARNIAAMHVRAAKRLKRGGASHTFSIDGDGEVSVPDETLAAPQDDDDFDLEWSKNLFRLALERLRRDHPRLAAVVDLHLSADLTYQEIAQRTGQTATTVDNSLRKAKDRLAEYVRIEIMEYSASPAEVEHEARRAATYLSGELPS